MRRLLPLIWFLLPSLVSASTCSYLANQINYDISRYGSSIGNKQLPWMNLSWLKNHLGTPETERVSPNQLQYKWVCPEENDSYISVVIDNTGRMTTVDGVYSTDDGAGTLSVCLSCYGGRAGMPAEAEVKPVIAPKPRLRPVEVEVTPVVRPVKPVVHAHKATPPVLMPVKTVVKTKTVAMEEPGELPVFQPKIDYHPVKKPAFIHKQTVEKAMKKVLPKLEVKPIKPVTQPLPAPAIKPVTKPIVKQLLKPMIKPVIPPAPEPVKKVEPETKIVTQPLPKPVTPIKTEPVKPKIKLVVLPAPKPVVIPAKTEPVKKPVPIVKPVTQPLVKPVIQAAPVVAPQPAPVSKPVVAPITKPVEELKPISVEPIKPVITPQPVSVPTPPAKPAIVIPLRPAEEKTAPAPKWISPLHPLQNPQLPLQRLKQPSLPKIVIPLPQEKPAAKPVETAMEKPVEQSVEQHVETPAAKPEPTPAPAPKPEETKPVEAEKTPAPISKVKLSCSAIMNQIYDIGAAGSGSDTKYPWEDLEWLKKNLGDVKLQRNNNISGYEWKCNGESMMYFLKQGQIIFGATKCVKGDCAISYASRVNGTMKGFSVKIQKQ